MAQPSPMLERSRTGWDVVLGILTVLAGMIALVYTVTASIISVLFLGWMALIGGIALVVAGIAGWATPRERWNVVTGALFGVLGWAFLSNPAASLAVLTLVAGSLLLVGGVVRIVVAFQPGAPRGLLLLNGAITLLLGLMVLNRWPVSALWFLGTIVGVQLVVDGITTAISGRVRLVRHDEPMPA
jgi:uncharacterized membrane protein HdeD (DUF308 family)